MVTPGERPASAGWLTLTSRLTPAVRQVLWDFHFHPQQSYGERLPLRVGAQRAAGPAGEGVVQDEVQPADVRRLEPLDLREPETREVRRDDFGREVPAQPREPGVG